jgi:predicted transcriptional regulator
MSIEKFSGAMSKEDLGCTIVVNETLQSITDFTMLAVYAYLLTRPQGWMINPKELIKHFGSSKDRVYNALNGLIAMNLLERIEYREHGRFLKYEYKLYLKPHINTALSPCPDFPEAVNKDAYKTNIHLQNKDKDNISDFIKTRQKENELIEEIKEAFHDELPELPKVRKADKQFRAQLLRMVKDWSEYQSQGKDFTIESFRDYLRLIKNKYTWLIRPYVTEHGNTRINGLRVLTRESTLTKIVNGEFSATY